LGFKYSKRDRFEDTYVHDDVDGAAPDETNTDVSDE